MPSVKPQQPQMLAGDVDVVRDLEIYLEELEDKDSARSENMDIQSLQCSICLDTSGAPCMPPLGCGHVFCQPCLIEHLERQLLAGRCAWCPCCRQGLPGDDLVTTCGTELLEALTAAMSSTSSDQGSSAQAGTRAECRAQRRAERAFRQAARRLHMKRCPSCNAAIEKHGGCNHMQCSCGHSFDWQEALTVVPCNSVHLEGCDGRGFNLWGRTCPNCTPLATAQLIALRAGIITLAIPVTAVGATLATATALVPAVVCAPLAVAYEPIRRLQNKPEQRNIFVAGMKTGLHANAVAAYLTAVIICGDSDRD
mmetsp:Transcript_9413/g.16691  ORF Transcript_9413/g.16691 Transcript_9413/m.16691 type:complete len:310 (-) Transcript_9413:151-1080(-)|eukprot:CAMPEP_0197625198 /NCGR_PEP_ID=MMETSP1338-20131121/4624_1 /TAXON_ID=43686 ORGANISM="Pelagodinium beii, Strain RCC1491" /NCGR_SAMPLE_ID=MMETSP1338 /ASSEMBLY_ACC=CAM_ASM_000754 /LENGTH=309 /DNA_ID=CAMNT_0043195535 /DNA_START=72 /DNA_END=1001 /DNA_ORIENTATION=+